MEPNDLDSRLDALEASFKEVAISAAEAKGAVKAGMFFVGALNALFLPAVFWLFSSALTCRDTNIAQEVKIEQLQSACQEQRQPRTALHTEEKQKPKDIVKPAVIDKALPPRVSLSEATE